MNGFGRSSRKHLATVEGRGQQLAYRVLRIKDHSIICGHRKQREQDRAYREGFSNLPWPDGKHNRLPSVAMDVQTYPVPTNEQALREEQLYLLGLYKGVGSEMDIPVRTGADWDGDGEILDNGFDDFFHVEWG